MQLQPDLATASRARDDHGRPPAAEPRRRVVSAPRELSAVLTDLSATVCQIRGLQQVHAGDEGLEPQLHRAAAELESLIAALLRTDGSGASPPPARRASADAPRRQDAEQAFLAWLADPTVADELPLAGGDAPEPLFQVLGELILSRRVLPDETAARIGLPRGITIGQVAVELVLAVEDPAGPRCRSFRAAASYLRDLGRGQRFEPDDGKVCR